MDMKVVRVIRVLNATGDSKVIWDIEVNMDIRIM
jgi:hypothetical protein